MLWLVLRQQSRQRYFSMLTSEAQTRSQAVARIADRTASQKTLVIIAIVLIGLAYYECISLI